jgi:FemAB family protein
MLYLPVDYDGRFIEFHRVFLGERAGRVADVCTVLYHDRKPVALWPVFIMEALAEPHALRLSSNGGPLLPPLFIPAAGGAVRDKLDKACARMAQAFCRAAGIATLAAQDMLGPRQAAIGGMHAELMRAGAVPSAAYMLYVDLSLSPEAQRASYRKSYKALINSGEKLWRVAIQQQPDAALFREFEQLHIAVAGRVTRSPATWDMQNGYIGEGSDGGAFLVYLRDEAGRMVGGGYFQHTAHEGLYLVGAYDRALFDKPLGHVVQHHAIAELRRRGVRWHKLGQRFYAGCAAPGTDKEQSISVFKEGFATHQFLRLDAELAIPQAVE